MFWFQISGLLSSKAIISFDFHTKKIVGYALTSEQFTKNYSFFLILEHCHQCDIALGNFQEFIFTKSFYPVLRSKNRCSAHEKTLTLPDFMRSVTRKQAFSKN